MKRRKEDQEDARLWDDEYESGADQDETCDGYERNPGESRYYYNSYDSHSQYDTQQYDGYDDGEDEDVRRQKPRYYYDRKKGWVREKEGSRSRSGERYESGGRRPERSRRKRRALPILLLVLILVIGLPLVWLLAKVRGMQAGTACPRDRWRATGTSRSLAWTPSPGPLMRETTVRM